MNKKKKKHSKILDSFSTAKTKAGLLLFDGIEFNNIKDKNAEERENEFGGLTEKDLK